MEKTYAVIDIGTLKVKTFIAQVRDTGQLDVRFASNTLTCFGCDMDQNNGCIKEEYLKRTIAELQRVKALFTEYGVTAYRVVATQALRRAKNQKEIIERIAQEVGFTVELITQEQEAHFFFDAVMRTFTVEREYALVDVGGGSVQILVGTPTQLKQTHLLHTGSTYLHDNFTQKPELETSHTTEADLKRMKEIIMEQLNVFKTGKNIPIIYGSSMIIDMMQAIKIPLDVHADSAIHPYQTEPKHLELYIQKLLPLSYAEREVQYNVGQKGYTWGMDKAFLNIVTIAEHLQSPYIVPTNANIAQGIIYSMIAK